MSEYDELAMEAQYYLNLAIKLDDEIVMLMDKKRELLNLARDTRDRAKEVAAR